MKRVFGVLMAMFCLLMTGTACADRYELQCGTNGYFVCEDFEGGMSQYAAQIFGDLVRTDDEVICGTLFEEHYRNRPDLTGRGGALMAVRRDGKILLMSANTNGKGWTAAIETDSFLPPDAAFSITTMDAGPTYVHLTILYRNTAYEIRTEGMGGAYLYEYSWTDETGKALHMDCYDGEFVLREEGDWPHTVLMEGKTVPVRLAAWAADVLPKTAESLHAFEQAHPLMLGDDEAYIMSVNLRESATGKSKTWGEYTAKVRILGQKPGNDAPWYNVRVGNIEGWASGVYVHRKNGGNRHNVDQAAIMVHPVGRTKTETALLHMPGEGTVMQLETDTYVHVLGERDGWLHVIVPRGELSWQTDWEGTYGFVRAQDVVVGISKADAMYKN